MTKPTVDDMAEACEQAANVQEALSRDRVARECARRLRAAAAALRTPETGGGGQDSCPKPRPEPAPPANPGAGRLRALARAAYRVAARGERMARADGAVRWACDVKDAEDLEEAVRPFENVFRLKLEAPTAPQPASAGEEDA